MDRFVHVMPLDDVISHEGTPRCVCGPGGQPVTAVDLGEQAADADVVGPGWSRPAVGLIYHHHALSPCREWEAVPET
ncbi:hypothetical protein GCM10009530_13220 [Microbispora corallina]|uniref:Uncharacterized protein n=1 Tax=Microbispora corallina TaxID=83302 RepID=A0ABQ4FT32_9ACTN|nr:hypothetical protein [Microbispora corallina]GIH37981.1 hypothetical protein Mco01_09810 [Microbispora corallina]